MRLAGGNPTRKRNGFTLIELIVVIVLLGIIGTFTFSYIGLGTQIFVDASAREQLVSQSRFAVQRFQREVSNALPRSIRVNASDANRCIEFMPIETSGLYLTLPREGLNTNTELVSVTPPVRSSLTDQYLFVYASSPAYIYANDESRRKRINTIEPDTPSSGLSTFTFDSTSPAFSTESPARRFYVSPGPVSWCLNHNGELLRFANYPVAPGQPNLENLPIARGEVMASGVSNNLADETQWPFRVMQSSLARTGLVQLNWRFASPRTGEPLLIIHEVHIPNAP